MPCSPVDPAAAGSAVGHAGTLTAGAVARQPAGWATQCAPARRRAQGRWQWSGWPAAAARPPACPLQGEALQSQGRKSADPSLRCSHCTCTIVRVAMYGEAESYAGCACWQAEYALSAALCSVESLPNGSKACTRINAACSISVLTLF